ncbi:MAG: hypothetical protein WC614_00300 [bacterium]
MFYCDEKEPILRFGDVLRGYVLVNPSIKDPISILHKNYDYKIDVEIPSYSVVLTPCCSISKKGNTTISLTPLVRIMSKFLINPYFKGDLTRINCIMEPQQSLPSDDWNRLSQIEREKRSKIGKKYACLANFIYEKNEIFEEYTLAGETLRNYMIDFNNVYRIKCNKIQMLGQPSADTTINSIIESKCLQLSAETRTQLKDKLSYYYRIPEEDIVD